MDIAGRLAVVTGGGSGMGRELVVQLAAGGCDVATCDVHDAELAETVALASDGAPGARVTGHRCDVSDEAQVARFRDEVLAQHDREHVNLLFNNAGVGGGYSFIAEDRAGWDRTFAICWGGVYNCSRAFVPLIVASDAGYIVNTSSVNGFWAALGPDVPHSAYSTAKFAVKGFSESLITDLRVHAPHVKVAVVMPGHIGTGIVANSMRILAEGPETAGDEAAEGDLDDLVRQVADGFRANAPVSASEAATVILDGVRNDEWRILVGDDARALDGAIRADPLAAYGAGGLTLRTITGDAGGRSADA
jgi:NAD(P)-dependent dehydrogenase (short-subunit alcohol dehydrogenase family)